MKKKINYKQLLYNSFNSLLKKSIVNNKNIVQFQDKSRKDLLKTYELSKQYNNKFSEYIKDVTSFEILIMDYFSQEETFDNESETIKFTDSSYNSNLEEHINSLIELIEAIPYEYSYIIPLSIKDERIKDINIRLADDLYLKGLEIQPPLFYQYLVARKDSGYYVPIKFPGKGVQLCLYGVCVGFIPKFYQKIDVEAEIKSLLEETLAILSFTGILQKEYSFERAISELNIFYYKDNQYSATSSLPLQLSKWVGSFKISDSVFEQKKDLILGLLGKDDSTVEPSQLFEKSVMILIDYLKVRESEIKDTLDFKRFSSALHWYLEALIAENKNIRFVDLYIVLEALIGSNNPKAWKNVEIPERAALLVGNNIKERSSITETIKNAGNKRNELVHEGAILSEEDYDLLQKLHEVTHKAMYKQLIYIRNSWIDILNDKK